MYLLPSSVKLFCSGSRHKSTAKVSQATESRHVRLRGVVLQPHCILRGHGQNPSLGSLKALQSLPQPRQQAQRTVSSSDKMGPAAWSWGFGASVKACCCSCDSSQLSCSAMPACQDVPAPLQCPPHRRTSESSCVTGQTGGLAKEVVLPTINLRPAAAPSQKTPSRRSGCEQVCRMQTQLSTFSHETQKLALWSAGQCPRAPNRLQDF